jgi:hypothetical protein
LALACPLMVASPRTENCIDGYADLRLCARLQSRRAEGQGSDRAAWPPFVPPGALPARPSQLHFRSLPAAHLHHHHAIESFASAVTTPVLHQKRSQRDATNAIESAKSSRKINASDTCPAAHNGLVAGSSPAGPTNVAPCLLGILLDLRTMSDRLSYAGTCCQRRERCSRRLQAALPRRPAGVFVGAKSSSRGSRDAADPQAEPKRPERCR